MPALDVSDLLSDPDFMDHFAVVRSVVTVDPVTGRGYEAQTTEDAFGVVTSGDGQNLVREADAARDSGTITVHTTYRLTEGSRGDGTDADIVQWNGHSWTVVRIDDYSRYGAGFVVATCSLYDHR